MKRLFSLILCTVMIFGTLAVGTAATDSQRLPFTDLKSSKWYYNAVKTVYEAGIMEGKSQTVFAPEEPMTRAQIVTVFYRLADRWETGLGKKLNFNDTSASAWYADYLGWAVEEEIVSGYPEGDFRPNAPISRQELAKLVVVFLNYIIADVNAESTIDAFTDAKNFPKWSREYIEELRATGLLTGDEAGRFNPEKSATRAELASLLARMLPYVEEALEPEAPPMGWNAYMQYYIYANEEALLRQMDAMVELGLKDVGFEYVNLDDWWYNSRDEETNRVEVWEEKFPHGMKYIADQAHERGLKAGLYTDLGYNTCGSGDSEIKKLGVVSGINVGLAAGNYVDDLNRYLGTGTYYDDYAKKNGTDPIECWGFDYIKVDSNGTKEGVGAHDVLVEYAEAIDDIERSTGRYIHFNMCRWYYDAPYLMTYGDSWRCGTDSYANFEYTKTTINKMKRVSSYVLPGHYADLDMLALDRDTMTHTEDRTTFAMWCMFSSPLILSCDLPSLSAESLEFLTNEELIALDQDKLAYSAAYIDNVGENTELWFKKTESYENGAGAVAIYNPGDDAETVTVDLSVLCRSGKADVRDVFTHTDLGNLSEITVTVQPHDVFIYTIDTDNGYTSEDIGDYRAYGVVNTVLDDEFSEILEDIVTLSSEDAQKLLKMPAQFRPIVVDVRSAEEYAAGHMEGAVNIQYTDIREAIKYHRLPITWKDFKNKAIIVYATDEETLVRAYRELQKYRYTVYSLGIKNSF